MRGSKQEEPTKECKRKVGIRDSELTFKARLAQAGEETRKTKEPAHDQRLRGQDNPTVAAPPQQMDAPACREGGKIDEGVLGGFCGV
ncbi:hypothetical protein CDL15_Pgr003240 [Punica granatum]|uniref:Uncharacterized protein n=1 Tax=Punica granatum TaxID=22663 RepID=A0A218X2W4_PUNGR|nr:hypothetical protein CDL15_Pgr003240 [Punica granatum]